MSGLSNAKQEEIVQHFQKLCQEQRSIALKMSELEMDRSEHKLVIDTLKEVDPKRKCFRMIGGVLVEREVSSVLPALNTNFDKMGEFVDSYTEQLKAKGIEINAYKEKHKIRIQGEKENKQNETESETETKSTQSVLVSHK